MRKVLILNGPNLNMLGKRPKEHYGTLTLAEINQRLMEANEGYFDLEFFQSNSEGELITRLQQSMDYFGILINPAAYTHTSVAIADAIKAVNIPAVEIHLSNINEREDFRKKSFTAPACIGQISGFGKNSYLAALFCLVKHLESRK